MVDDVCVVVVAVAACGDRITTWTEAGSLVNIVLRAFELGSTKVSPIEYVPGSKVAEAVELAPPSAVTWTAANVNDFAAVEVVPTAFMTN